MDPGWDLPSSGSGAGYSQSESSYYQDSNAWDLSNNPPDAYENSQYQHDTFWGAEPQAFNVTYDDEVFGTYDNSTFASDLKPGELMNAKTPPTYDQATMTWFISASPRWASPPQTPRILDLDFLVFSSPDWG